MKNSVLASLVYPLLVILFLTHPAVNRKTAIAGSISAEGSLLIPMGSLASILGTGYGAGIRYTMNDVFLQNFYISAETGFWYLPGSIARVDSLSTVPGLLSAGWTFHFYDNLSISPEISAGILYNSISYAANDAEFAAQGYTTYSDIDVYFSPCMRISYSLNDRIEFWSSAGYGAVPETDEYLHFVKISAGFTYHFGTDRWNDDPGDEEKIISSKGDISFDEKNDSVTSITLANIHFKLDSYEIPAEKIRDIDSIALYIKKRGFHRITIIGHSDDLGKDKYNIELSEKRAKSVYDYLVSHHGFDQAKLTYTGLGDTSPVADNKTEDGRARNRRVEFIVEWETDENQ